MISDPDAGGGKTRAIRNADFTGRKGRQKRNEIKKPNLSKCVSFKNYGYA